MLRKFVGLLLLSSPVLAWAAGCPGADDEPALMLKSEAGPTVILCGFEDHEVESPTGKRAFSDFTVYFTTEAKPEPQKLFSSDVAETFWVKSVENKSFELEEVWFFSEQPKPALWREISCTADSCSVSAAKCVFSMKANPFPKALQEFEKKLKAKKVDDNDEELLDQIWAQALLGDTKAKDFYNAPVTGLNENLKEVFDSNKKKLTDLQSLNCK
jgi:hypothetical protein